MIPFEATVSEILATDTSDFYERDPETFFASHIGLCPRQLYLSKLGLTRGAELRGQYRVTRLIQKYLEDRITDQYPRLTSEASIQIDDGSIKFIGRCNLFDSEEEIAYSLKARNGWYKFTPPVDRHLDQLHLYMRGLSVEQGRLVYVSKNDVGDIRQWPPSDEDQPHVAFDQDRYDQFVTKAKRIRDAIWADGIATTPADIPFQDCGCYFCQEEDLAFPETPAPVTTASADAASDASGFETDSFSDRSLSPENATNDQDTATVIESDGGCKTTVSSGATPTMLQTDGIHVPRELRDLEVWVVWDGQSKVALAPWQEGTMYPCEWAASKDVNPRRSFANARRVTELPVRSIHQSWPFPDANDLPETIYPAILLPHDPPTPPVSFVDLDDVRDPGTGIVTGEAAAIVDRLDGYTELSVSGTGVHTYVRGQLPERVGAFHAPLADKGTIEIYDHSRFTGGTWRHIEETPPDSVPVAHDVLTNLIAKYGDRQ